jgi:hypothetical protein
VETKKIIRDDSKAARSPADADGPAVPPGLLVPLVATGLLFWRANRWTAGLALVIGVFIGVGSFVPPSTGDHLASGDTAPVVSTVAELVALAGLVVAGSAVSLRTGARA